MKEKKNQMAALRNLNHIKIDLTQPYGFDFHMVEHFVFLLHF